MSIAVIALLSALNGPVQEPAPRVERRSEVRIVRADGSNGPGNLDADGDGVVTREEFAAPLTSAFDRLDTNGDGRLSSEEMAAGAREGSTSISHVFTSGDLPAGGGAPRVMILGGGSGNSSVHTSRQVFRIGPDGVEGDALPGGPGQSRVFVRRLGGPDDAGNMDKDGDGRVSEEEFLAPLRDAFRSMDANGNGFLDDGEATSGSRVPPPPPPPAR